MPITANSRWRKGDRDAGAREGHNEQTREMRRAWAVAALAPVEEQILAALAAGGRIAEVAEAHGVTSVALHGRASWDVDWSRRLDAALMEGRDETLDHGRRGTYRHQGCRCPECRAAQHS
ncbi:hypothetical protein EDD29_0033 [Actinocorallia herbida]|uniref:Uncharacterized protein n=1 Tax=Actinocorallia herbida TaxID=58109 RepID=A0A3N1CMN7_9ACTN|nr:hypothetical protein [Actinocorallia herbida]ROO82553.1 hypothetical protein EDD29_0033 [Actinocorallia herbida]